MTGLVIICFCAIGFQDRVSVVKASLFDVDNELRAFVNGVQIACQHYADLVRKDLFTSVIHHPAAIAIAVKSRMACSISIASGLGL